MKIGLSYETAYALPFGELCDLIAVEQIRNEGAKMKIFLIYVMLCDKFKKNGTI